jgi:hypothetical protein
MGADQVAAIRPALAELESDQQALGGDARARCFARFSLSPYDTPWVEVDLEEGTVVNLWYPFETEPLAYLESLGVKVLPGARVLEVARPACTLAFDRVPSEELARFVDSLFLDVFACGEDYPVDVEVRRCPEAGEQALAPDGRRAGHGASRAARR